MQVEFSRFLSNLSRLLLLDTNFLILLKTIPSVFEMKIS